MKKYRLGELISVKRGTSLSGEYYATQGKLVRLTLGNFREDGGFKENTSKDDLFFTGTVREEFILHKGDIITPLTEQVVGLLGSTARIPEDDKYIQSGDVALVKCISDEIDDGYCYYLVSSKLVRRQLNLAAQQTKIRHTSPEKIMDCEVFIPEVKEQKKIARILENIDRKIQINNEINDNLPPHSGAARIAAKAVWQCTEAGQTLAYGLLGAGRGGNERHAERLRVWAVSRLWWLDRT